MTSYASPSYFACPGCDGAIEIRNLVSGNTFGARYWTDGYREAPMLPEQLPLLKCSGCTTVVWVEELQQLDDAASAGLPVVYGKEPSFDDYIALCKANSEMDEARMRYVRMRAWWRGNEQRRLGVLESPLSGEERKNLAVLLDFLDVDMATDRLMAAEVYRQLSYFDKASTLLEAGFSSELQVAANFIQALIGKRLSAVAEIQF